MPNEEKTVIDVIDLTTIKETQLCIVKLISGDLSIGMVFTCYETGVNWQIKSLGFISSDSWDKKLRGVMLEQLNSGSSLQTGLHLIERKD